MQLSVERVSVWAAGIDDKAGALAAKLTALAEAGADLDFVVARRAADQPGKGVVFVTPLLGDAEIAAAAEVGFSVSQRLHSLRIQGTNEPGICAKLTGKLGRAGINMRGLSAAVIGAQFIIYIAFDTDGDAAKAARLLERGD